MLRRAMDLGGFHQVIFICHTPLVWGLGEAPAEKDVGIALDRGIRNAILIRKMANQFAGRIALIQEIAMHADHDHRLGRRITVPAQPVSARGSQSRPPAPTRDNRTMCIASTSR